MVLGLTVMTTPLEYGVAVELWVEERTLVATGIEVAFATLVYKVAEPTPVRTVVAVALGAQT